MRIPTANFAGHLQWTRSGVIWATWRLQGLPDGMTTDEIRALVIGQHQDLFQSLRGEALLMGMCASTDPVDVVNRMLDGLTAAEVPMWLDECALTLDQLSEVALGERVYWLSVPLASGNWKNRALAAGRAGLDVARESVGIARSKPSEDEIRSATAASKLIEQVIPVGFQMRRASVAEQVWIAIRSQQRGLGLDEAAPNSDEPTGIDEVPATHLPAAMPKPWLDEGGQSDLVGPGTKALTSAARRFMPFNRRYLKVQSPYSDTPSYQVMMAVAAGPKEGWSLTKVPWISRVDQYPGADVDWAIRMVVSSAASVKNRNKRAEEQLMDQLHQQAGTLAITGAKADLQEIAETQAAYTASLNRSENEVEVSATVIFAVGGRTAEEAKEIAQYVAADYKSNHFKLVTPLGGQEDLWWAMQPGTPMTRLVRDLAQLTTGREFASGLPLISAELGDRRGLRVGNNITTGRPMPILLDLAGLIEGDMSASFGVISELGSGKSTLLKCIAGSVIDRGGAIFALDRTVMREYAKFLKAIADERDAFGNPMKKTIIADMLDPQWSLDPLRIWGPAKGARMVQSLFALMLNIDPLDDRGIELSSLLEADYVITNGITSLNKLHAHLKSLADTNPIAQALYKVINVIASKDLGKVLFDDSLPPLDLAADAIVVTTTGLTLPDKAEVENEHLFKTLPLESKFGRAIYAMLAMLAQEFCFMDSNRFALALFDEVHHLTASRDGTRVLQTFFRDGRKHLAACGVASHDPYDIGDEVTRGLIKIRFIMRQTDELLATRAIEWAGLPVTAERIKEVAGLSPMGPDGKVPLHRRGEGIMRDARARYGKLQVTLPARPLRRASVLSTPSMLKDAA